MILSIKFNSNVRGSVTTGKLWSVWSNHLCFLNIFSSFSIFDDNLPFHISNLLQCSAVPLNYPRVKTQFGKITFFSFVQFFGTGFRISSIFSAYYFSCLLKFALKDKFFQSHLNFISYSISKTLHLRVLKILCIGSILWTGKYFWQIMGRNIPMQISHMIKT